MIADLLALGLALVIFALCVVALWSALLDDNAPRRERSPLARSAEQLARRRRSR